MSINLMDKVAARVQKRFAINYRNSRYTMSGSKPRVSAVLLLLLLCFVSCTHKSSDVLGEAYIAPASVQLRRDLTERGSTVATLQHGQEVAIIGVRRVFLKVRAPDGAEGWLSTSDLLTPDEMERIRRERLRASKLPSEGSATVYGTLNVHVEPSRTSPAFTQVRPNQTVQVLAHRVAPRTRGNHEERTDLFITQPAPEPDSHRASHKKKRTARFSLPKLPPPPPPPSWIHQSAVAPKRQALPPAVQDSRPVVMEDWTLVRTKNKLTGWVLSRDLYMTIPSDVQQYAEGKRITSYFDLGTVTDSKRGVVKHNWLWTTASTVEPCDFDSWRVFLWSLRHHRYETSFRERNIQGYFPVHVDPPEEGKDGRTFELVLKGADGKLRRQTYLFDGVRVHLVAVEDASAPSHHGVNVTPAKSKPKTAKPGWFRRKWETLKSELRGI